MQIELAKNWIILFDSNANEIYLTMSVPESGLPFLGMICNFPDFAKVWTIPETGCKVFIDGISYLPTFGSIGEVQSFDYILTILKID